MRTLVIGDIHSGLKGLKQLLNLASVTQEDQLIFLGDYVDGWSTAVETVSFLIELKKSHNCIFLRGNHDVLCQDWLLYKKDNPLWLQHGGRATLSSYSKANDDTIAAHLNFFDELVNYYLDDQNRLFLHAGFTNLKGIEHEYFEQTFYWDRTLWELACSLDPQLAVEDIRYPKRLKNYHEIYIGHTPISKNGLSQPQNAANVWNVDTGAAFKGSLSMLDINTKEVWQSDPLQHLYPNEPGRN